MSNIIDTNSTSKTENDATIQRYTFGFAFSLIMTVVPFILAVQHLLEGWQLAACFVAFALLQVFVQLQYFLHIGDESKPRWNLMIFGFMVLVVFIVVFGSLWIMNNLDYHMDSMTPEETDSYIIEDEGIRH